MKRQMLKLGAVITVEERTEQGTLRDPYKIVFSEEQINSSRTIDNKSDKELAVYITRLLNRWNIRDVWDIVVRRSDCEIMCTANVQYSDLPPAKWTFQMIPYVAACNA